MKNYIETLFKYSHLLKELVIRDIKVRYKKSFLGLIWTVLNPLLMMLITSIVFSNLFKNNIANFPVYVLLGNIAFTFVSESTTQALMSILGNAALIKKVYIPKYLFPLSKVISSLVNYGFSLIALVFVMIITKAPFYITLVTLWIPLLYLFVFSLGIGLILSAINVYFRDIGHLYSVFITAWMYLTPIFYSIDIVPNDVQRLIKLNPLYHFVDFFRKIVLDGVFPSLQTNLYCIVISLTFLIIGGLVFSKLQKKFILYL